MSNVLITGASGFLGKELIQVFDEFTNYKVYTLGRSEHNTFCCDLTYSTPNIDCTFDLVIHAAGKAHIVPKTNYEKQDFFDVNVNGTANLLKGLENSGIPRSFVFISSVAVYGIEKGELIKEDEPLVETNPYGLSKIQAEKLVINWCARNNVVCTILRLPLIAGPNPPGNLKSMIQGIQKGYYFNVGDGKAKKSIVLAEDVARIIPKASEIGGVYNLTDGYHPTFAQLSGIIAKQLDRNCPLNIPNWLAQIIAKTGDVLGSRFPLNSNKLIKITSDLTFDDTKARENLGWNPKPVLEGFKIVKSEK